MTYLGSSAVQKRFWEKVDTSAGPDQCWPWRASRNRDGYGKFKINGSVRNASSVAYELHNQRVLQRGEVVRHTCDNPCCCNPSHLIIGSQSDNMQDMRERGRHARRGSPGEANPSAKLTAQHVAEIKRRIAQGEGNGPIAADYPVGAAMISRIRTGVSWR